MGAIALIATLAAACPWAVGCSSSSPELAVLEYDAILPVGVPHRFEVGTHWGVGVLRPPFNGRLWTTDESHGATNWAPEAWQDALDDLAESLVVQVELAGTGDTLTVTVAGHAVSYRPVTDDDRITPCA